jgi:VCBS repeat protein/FG-GAP repeat protein
MSCKRVLNGHFLIVVSLFFGTLNCQLAQAQAASAPSVTPLFLPPVAYDSGGYTASFVAVGDVNGDGKLDLVVGNECANRGCLPGGAAVGVLLGNGDGSFQPAVTHGTGGGSGPFWPVSIVIADVNGDHKPDLLVANGGSNTVGVLLGNGDGTFQPAVAYGSGAFFPVSVAVADVNGDGQQDIVVANECGPVFCDGSVGVLLGNGDGTFRAVVIYSSGGLYGLSVAVADVNADGRPDLLVANGCAKLTLCGTRGAVAVLLGNGDGTFQAATEYLSGGAYPYSLKVVDLNGDGRPDLVAANSFSGTVSVLLGNGNGTFRAAMTYSSGDRANVAQISSVAVADVNGDGRPDLLLTTQDMGANGNNGGAVSVLLGHGDGTFQAAVEHPSGGFQTLGVAVGDVNGDGRPDVLIANSCSQNNIGCGGPISQTRGTVTVLLNNSVPPDTTPPVITLSVAPKVLWPPNGRMVPVTISGTIVDTGSGVNANTAAYAVQDEYGEVQPLGAINLGPGGTYSFTVLLQASRLGTDLDGRRYTVIVGAKDNAGNGGSKTSVVTVPHDQGH